MIRNLSVGLELARLVRSVLHNDVSLVVLEITKTNQDNVTN